jgi:hypothetical protein
MAPDEQERRVRKVLLPALVVIGLAMIGLGVLVNTLFDRSLHQGIKGAYVESAPAAATPGATVKIAVSALAHARAGVTSAGTAGSSAHRVSASERGNPSPITRTAR